MKSLNVEHNGSLTNREALLALAEGCKITKKCWGCLAYVYMDNFGVIRHSDGFSKYNWNERIQSDNELRWELYE